MPAQFPQLQAPGPGAGPAHAALGGLGSQRSLPFSDPGVPQVSSTRLAAQLQPGMMAHSLPAMPGGHMALEAAQGAYLGAPMGGPPLAAVQGYPVQIPPGYALVPAMHGVHQMPVRASKKPWAACVRAARSSRKTLACRARVPNKRHVHLLGGCALGSSRRGSSDWA